MKSFVPFEDPLAAVGRARRRRADAGDVRARARLGDRDRGDRPARRDPRHPARLLRRAPGVVQMRARHVGVDEDGDDEAAEGRLRQRFGEDQVGERVGAGAAVLLGVHQAEQAGVAELSQHLARRHAGVLPGERMRLDLARDEARDLLAQQLVLGGEIDAFHRSETSRLRRTASPRSSRAHAGRRREGALRSASGTRRAAAARTAVPASIACAWPRWCTWWLSRWAMTWPRRSRWIRPFAAVELDDLVEHRRDERVDVVDEALVGARLRGGDRRERHAGRRRRARSARRRPRRAAPRGSRGRRRGCARASSPGSGRSSSAPPRSPRARARASPHAGDGWRAGWRAPACAGRRAAPWGLLQNAAGEPALDLVAPVVAPERLAVDDEERRAEDALRDRVVARRLEAALPARLGPDALGLGGVEAELGRERLQVLGVREVDACRA